MSTDNRGHEALHHHQMSYPGIRDVLHPASPSKASLIDIFKRTIEEEGDAVGGVGSGGGGGG